MLGRTRTGGFVALVAVALLALTGCPAPTDGGGPRVPTPHELEPDPTANTFVFSPVLSGFSTPTNAAFAPDGRVFVTEKSGIIKTFDSVGDQSPTIAADLRQPVRDVGEHGLIGITVDNDYPTRPFIYVAHSWDITGLWGDGCKASYQVNGCVTAARIAKITVDSSGVMVGAPETLVEDRWCYQFGAHAIGSVEMLEDGSLAVTSGEGASWQGTDYGQFGGSQLIPPVDDLTPKNPCGDPPGGVGVSSPSEIAEGGSLRSQDLLTDSDPLGWNGALVRIDADTGDALPDNPLYGGANADDDEMIAHGLRNPNRFTQRPGTDEIFIGNVGQNYAEEIDVASINGPVANFGWPCREGGEVHPPYESLDSYMCEDLLTAPGAPSVLTDPWFHYTRPTSGAAITGLRFVPSGQYPAEYVGDLFFVDYVKGNVWSLGINPDGSRTAAPPEALAYKQNMVALVDSPDGYLYGVDIAGGTIDRLSGAGGPPVAKVMATPQQGDVPLSVDLDASESEQPGGGALTFAWDLDDDGSFDDATGPTASTVLNDPVNHDVSVQVTNQNNDSTVASTTIYPGNHAPQVSVDVTSPLPWVAGDPINFEVTASDAEDGILSGPSIQWETLLRHCYDPSDCHSHPDAQGSGANGTVDGPSHGYPSFLELIVRVTDSRGQTTEYSQDLQPATAIIDVTSSVPGASVTMGESTLTTPFSFTAILGDSVTVSVSQSPVIGGTQYLFGSWSNGEDATHLLDITGNQALNLVLVPG